MPGWRAFDCGGAPRSGRVTIRRLNRNEYNNTIRDLLGVDVRPADDFPSDDVGYGFDNVGDVLSLPPILLEKYLAAAERVVQRALGTDQVNLVTGDITGGRIVEGGARFLLNQVRGPHQTPRVRLGRLHAASACLWRASRRRAGENGALPRQQPGSHLRRQGRRGAAAALRGLGHCQKRAARLFGRL